MDKDALGSKKTKESKNKTESNTPLSASPLIFILAGIAIFVALIYFFKDSIFKNKTKNLDELVEEKKTETETEPEPTEPETLTPEESEPIQDKFAKLQ